MTAANSTSTISIETLGTSGRMLRWNLARLRLRQTAHGVRVAVPRADAHSDLERKPWLLTEARPESVDLVLIQPAFKHEGATD